MKNILLNKKWLGIITLLFLVISLSSCSAFGYWWGEYQEEEWGISGTGTYEYWGESKDFQSPWDAVCGAVFSPLVNLIPSRKDNFMLTLTGFMWFLGLVSAFLYFLGRTDDVGGVKNYTVKIDGKSHSITDYSGAYTMHGTGSVERGNSWAERIICFLFCLYIYCLLYNWITGWFDDPRMLIKVIIGGGIIWGLYCIWGILLPIANLVKYISWVFCTIDFILGVIVTLWIN